MINLAFFPSRQLAFYMAKLFVTRTFAVLVMLVLVLMTLDLLGQAGKILAVPGNTDSDLWRYVILRIPPLISRFLPFSALLGTLIAFVTLNQNSEVVAMKAAGLSAHQILAPLILTAMAISVFSFGFNERIVTRASASLKAWEQAGNMAPPSYQGVPYDLMADDPMTTIDEAHNFEPHYDRHVWIYRDNPNGVFAQFNPNATCKYHLGGAHKH